MAAKKIPPLDLMFYLTETPQSPKHVGAVQIYKIPANAPKTFMRDLVEAFKAAPVESPFNYRPHFPRFGYPEWHVDNKLDIDYHVRHSALPQPGTDEVLLQVLQRLHSGLLNRDRPGWLCQVIEGLEGGRFAIYSKVHHAYIDGMSGVKRMYGSMSSDPKEMQINPSWSQMEVQKTDSERKPRAKKRAGKADKALVAQAKAMAELYKSFMMRGLEFFNTDESGAQRMFHAPRTPMNDRVEYDTRSIGLCTLPLDKVRAVAAKFDAKVNDVVLAVVDGALHDYLEAQGENTNTPLVALCPMSIREEGDDSATTQATALHVRLGEPGATSIARLRQIVDSSRASKDEARTMSSAALMNLAVIMIASLEMVDRTKVGRFLSPSYNVLVSNVPGPPQDELYLRGARHLASYPISAFLPGGNLNVTVLSHGNNLDFGLVADKQTMPDIQYVVARMEKRFAELAKGVKVKRRATPKVKARKSTRKS